MVGREERRALAKLAADYVDAQKTSSKLYRKTEREVKSQGIHIQEYPLYERLHHLGQERDKKAYELVQKGGNKLPENAVAGLKTEFVERAASRYKQYLIVREIAAQKEINPSEQLKLAKSAHDEIHIGPKNAYINNHIEREASNNGLSKEDLTTRIEKYQATYNRALLRSLRDKHPVLEQYIQTANQRNKLTGYRAELLDKDLSRLAKQIVTNKPLAQTIKQNFSDLTKSLRNSISLGKDRGIDR